jgi:hypothetical protein
MTSCFSGLFLKFFRKIPLSYHFEPDYLRLSNRKFDYKHEQEIRLIKKSPSNLHVFIDDVRNFKSLQTYIFLHFRINTRVFSFENLVYF